MNLNPLPLPRRDRPNPQPGHQASRDCGPFEAEELSESEAAAQAHTYHGSSVLVTVDFSANIDAVDAWMEGKDISQRNVNATHIPPNIHAFVKGVTAGRPLPAGGSHPSQGDPPSLGDLPSGQDPGGASGAGGASGSTGAEGPSGDAAGTATAHLAERAPVITKWGARWTTWWTATNGGS